MYVSFGWRIPSPATTSAGPGALTKPRTMMYRFSSDFSACVEQRALRAIAFSIDWIRCSLAS